MTHDASVIIITYNRADTIFRCLESLRRQSVKPVETIVVDSSDAEETRKIAKKFRNVRYFHTKKRVFQPTARNIGLRKCRGDIVAFLDDDAVASETWLQGIVESYTDEKTAGACGPAINADENLNPTEKIIRSSGNFNRFTFAGDILSEARRWIPPEPEKCTIMLGANMSFLRKTLTEAGGFDEFYGRHAAFREETDPQIAIVKKGFHFIYNPKALVWHMAYKSGGIRSNPKKDYYYWCGVNHKYMIDKHDFSKFWSRLSWLTFSRNPPSIIAAIMIAILRKDLSVFGWYKGLFSKTKVLE